MNKWTLRALAGILSASLVVNMWFYMEYRQSRDKLNEVEALVSQNIERNIRQSMRQIDFLLKAESPESLQRLQSAVDDLASSYMQWVLMHQTEEEPNDRLKAGLAAMESLRNMLVNQLDRQYRIQDQQLTAPDREMLAKVHDQLGRLLLIYHNIQGRLDELKNPYFSDGGLAQVTEQMMETTLLYRHSAIPNQHPTYLDAEEALRRAAQRSVFFEHEDLTLLSDRIMITEGIHVYESRLLNQKPPAKISIDARDGLVRKFQLEEMPEGEPALHLEEALEIARNLLAKIYEGRVKEEYVIHQNGSNLQTYLFRFTPLTEKEVTLTSDAHLISISAVDGTVTKYSNDYVGTLPPEPAHRFTWEEIRREQQPEFGRMLYEGESVIRTFGTRYRPRLTYGFRVLRNGQPFMLYFDIETGKLIDETFDVYRSVQAVVRSS